jgi:hypothetical protein
MEKSTIIRNFSRLILGLILCYTPLGAKEIFDVPFKWVHGLKFDAVEEITFSYSGDKRIDIDRIIEDISRDRAQIIVTGDEAIEGRALSPHIFITVSVKRNDRENAYLVRINATVNGLATKAINTSEVPLSGHIPIANRILVFVDTEIHELERSISENLQDLANNITSSTSKKPTFFILH